ncbi:hypothetical protein IFO70_39545 [Phormidium tenue FACHB-886]|nr:hypothetical protein [Phormidium tenue FACHB-886]
MSFIAMGNRLFVTGSLLFTVDCIGEVLTEVSVHTLSELLAGLMFTIGSVLLMLPPKVE